jgi:hypothetical protein
MQASRLFMNSFEERQRQACSILITDILADLKSITSAANRMIDALNDVSEEKTERIVFEGKTPEELVMEIQTKLLKRLERLGYEKLDACVKKESFDLILEKWTVRSMGDVGCHYSATTVRGV